MKVVTQDHAARSMAEEGREEAFLSLSHVMFTLSQNVFATHEHKQEKRSLTASNISCILTLKTQMLPNIPTDSLFLPPSANSK